MIERRSIAADTSAIEDLLLSSSGESPEAAPKFDTQLAPSVRGGTYRPLGVRPMEVSFRVSATRTYRLEDLVALQDKEFIHAAYQLTLGRPPDAQGGFHYLAKLRNGAAKTEILGRLRYSEEGRRHGSHIPGLSGRYALHVAFHIPIVGPLIEALLLLLRLPALMAYARRIENYASRSSGHALDQVAALDAHIARQLNTEIS